MDTYQDRDPLYADSKQGDLGDEIIEVGIERRSNRVMGRAEEALDKLGLTDQMTATQVLELQYEHRRLLAWAMGPDVRGASLEQLRSMKMAFDDTKSGAVRLVLQQMRRIEALGKTLIAISRCEDRGYIYLLVREALRK